MRRQNRTEASKYAPKIAQKIGQIYGDEQLFIC